jgi:HAD superfamily hydrolase (TIGR01549 family)
MAIKGLIFDLGQTLMYFDGIWSEVARIADGAMVECLMNAGCDLDSNRFAEDFRTRLNAYYIDREHEFIELTTAHILRTLLAEHGYPSVSASVVEQALECLYQESQAYWKPEKDAQSTLTILKNRGYRLGVISNAGDDADVQNLIDKAGVRSFLDFILTSAAYGIRKPDPKIFHIALEQWGFLPQEVAMVGDTLGADVLGGKNAGLFTIWITRRVDTSGNHTHQDAIQPDAVIHTLAELPDLLESLP